MESSASRAIDPIDASVGERVRQLRRQREMSLQQVALRAELSVGFLSQIERGLRKPSAEILQQIARALEISSETLYVRAGILDEPTDELDLIAEIRRDRHINEDQKKTMVRIYESFRRENEPTG